MKREICWFLDLYHGNQLDLNPPYQRRSAWTLKDRKFFLDTIFRNYPSPAVFLHKKIDETMGKMIYHVVDGKQRLETIILFTQNGMAIDREFGDERLGGKKWKKIENDPDLAVRFRNYQVTIEFIDTDDANVINEVFDRLNRNSRRLERQELRHAKYDGWFIRVTEKEAEKEEWERFGIVTKARMRRMKDVQCISDLLTVILKKRVTGYDQDALDDMYAEYDSPYETVPDFDNEEFHAKLSFAKDYLSRMDICNGAVSKHAKALSNFYSLWSFVVLNQSRLDTPEITAEKYEAFMDRVSALAKARDMSSFREYDSDLYSKAYEYLKNSVKTGMNQAQREARQKTLEDILFSCPAHREAAGTDIREADVSLPGVLRFSQKEDHGEHILRIIMGKKNSINKED